MNALRVDLLAVLERERVAADDFRCASPQLSVVGPEEYMRLRTEAVEAIAAVRELVELAQDVAGNLVLKGCEVGKKAQGILARMVAPEAVRHGNLLLRSLPVPERDEPFPGQVDLDEIGGEA